jgi:hypothetical protein
MKETEMASNYMPNDARRMARIIRMSRAMAWVTLAVAVGLPLALAITAVADPAGFDRWLVDALSAGSGTILTPTARILCIALGVIPLTLIVTGLLILRRLFLGFARGAVLVPESGRRLRRIGVIVALLAPVTIVAGSLASLAASWANAPGSRELAVGLSGNDVLAVISGALLVVLGWTLEEAARIADENRQFV